jgi:hemoglobin
MSERSLPQVLRSLCALCLLLSWGAALSLAANAQPPQEKSLYERLGGYNPIAAVVDDFFAGHSVDSKKRIRQHIVDQFCAAAGGPCVYTGRTMKASHEGLGITEAQWDAAAKHLVATLDKFKVPKREKDDLLAFVTTLKKDIVEK